MQIRRNSYSSEQIEWLKLTFKGMESVKDANKRQIENEFLTKFGLKRSFRAMIMRAREEGFRPKHSDKQVGVTRKRSKRDGEQILISKSPLRYQPINRYVWEKETGEGLTCNDVIVNIKGIESNPDISSLRKLTKTEMLLMNKEDKEIPIETRLLIARVKNKISSFEGKGEWSEDEMEWVMQNGRKNGGINFWVRLTNKFNNTFKKNRTNRCLIMMFYHKRKETNND